MKKIIAIFVLVALVIPSVMAMTANDGKNVGSIMLNNPPAKPTISGPTSGETGKSYTYTAVTTDPDGDKVFYCFDWGDGDEICTDLYNSGQEVTVSHTWNSDGDYTITVKATDENGAESEPATLKVTMPLSYDKATLSGYTGTLRVYIVEPTSRWNDHDGDPYHFGFLDYAFVGNLSTPYGETQVENITWNPSDAGYNDVNENNIMAIAAVFNPKVHQGHADPPFGNPFDAYHVDAAAAAMPGAKCPMAAMVDADELLAFKREKGMDVVSYVNTSAEVKAVSDICCTSANAVKVVKSMKNGVIFVPDSNLGRYVKRFVTDKEILLWPGFCPTHESISREDILKLREMHPGAEIMVHPECSPEVIDIADKVASTEGMVRYAKESNAREFIVATEKDLCYRLKKEMPEKEFYYVEHAICPTMKKITLDKVIESLEKMGPELIIDKETLIKAREPLEKMMEMGR